MHWRHESLKEQLNSNLTRRKYRQTYRPISKLWVAIKSNPSLVTFLPNLTRPNDGRNCALTDIRTVAKFY